MRANVLIVDDEPNILLSFSSLVKDEGHRAVTAESAEKAEQLLASETFDLVLLDLQLPGRSGLDLLERLREQPHAPKVLVISGQADIPAALRAVRLGAVDFLEKPVPPEKLISSLTAALALAMAERQRTLLVDEMDESCRMVGNSPAMQKLFDTIAQVAPTDTTVMVTGPNGTGKELIAGRIYLQSKRRKAPYLKVNCPGIPETLFESELFGHVKGAFTGAVKDHPGKFVQADGGTVFLDEIGDLPLACQAKLLRVLETGEVETLGRETARHVDVRVICATNRDLPRLVQEGKFRQDLYYRISVFEVKAPPLETRREDIPLLVGEFLRRYDASGTTVFTPAATAFLTTLEYPGHVRQLKNLIERVSILYKGRTVDVADLASHFGSPSPSTPPEETAETTLVEQVGRFERQLIAQILAKCRGNISEAARRLGVDRGNLSRKIKEYQIKADEQ